MRLLLFRFDACVSETLICSDSRKYQTGMSDVISSMLTGVNIFLIILCIHIVTPLMPILPILNLHEKSE